MTERAIFEAVVEIRDLAKRATFLNEACGGDVALRQRIESLVSSHENASQFLNVPVLEQFQPAVVEANSADDVNSATVTLPVSSFLEKPNARRDGDSDDELNAAPDISFLEASSKPGSIGTLGHYEILQVLGQGGFGIVFKAFDEKLHRHVAIKTMSPQMAATSPPRKRFLREARSAAAIKHENIVQVYSVEEQPLPYLVMEYIDGQTLQQRQRSHGPLEVAELLHFAKQIASGLASAHAQGLIHRDIKPANILLENGVDQKVKITDFGLARAADDASLTRSGMISGTPMYMAPEQALGQPLDHRSDLFSMGSVLYELASGRPPFRAASTVAVLKRVVDDTPRPIQEIISEVPDWLVAIINKLLAKNPDERFQTAKEVADLLAKCQSELQLTGKVTGVEQTVGWPPRPSESVQQKDNNPKQTDGLGGHPTLAYPTAPPLANPLPAAQNKQTRWRTKSLWTQLALTAMATLLLMSFFNRPISKWLNPAPPVLPKTEVAGGLSFDGKDDWVQVSNVEWSYPQYTLEAFVTSANGSDNGTVAYLTSRGTDEEWMSLFDGSPATPGDRISGAAIKGKTPYANAYGRMKTGVREHRALVFDGYKLHYYLNGAWQGERRAAAHEGMMWKMNELRLGCNGEELMFFRGQIDQVRISKVARYTNNFTPITSVATDASTLAFYNFDEGQGDVLKDASGNGHHGKVFGATWISAKSPASSLQPSTITPQPTAWHGWPADAPAPAIAPFDAAQAKVHQEAWAAYLKLPVEYTNSLGMKFVLIPPGEFTMGSTAAEIEATLKLVGGDQIWQEFVKSEAPQHKVVLTQAIYLGVNEVTQKEYEAVMQATPSHFASTGPGKEAVANLDTQNHPVEMVSWNDAAEFCAKLSQKEELKPFYFRAGETITPLDGTGYRLPTEAEWEFACRAGTTTKYWIGDKDDALVRAGWFGSNSGGRTHAAGELKANPLGLYDMHGNVWEWMEDAWDPLYYDQFAEQPAVNPSSPFYAVPRRVLRGGDWELFASGCRSTERHAFEPWNRGDLMGFRVSLLADAVKDSLKRQGVAAGLATPPNSEAPIDFAAERKAAERLLKLKKGVGILTNEKNNAYWELKEPLPEEPFFIQAAHFVQIDLTNEELSLLAGCRGLGDLSIEGNSKLTAAGLRALDPLPRLRLLYLHGTQCGRDGLEFLANYPNLADLMLPATGPEILRTLPDLPTLRRLRNAECNPWQCR